MSDSLLITIVTPEAQVFHGEARDISVSGWEGEYQVLAGHDRVLSLVRGGVIRLLADGEELAFAVGRGFAEVSGNHVVVLTDSCERPAQIDRAAAEAEREAVSAAMVGASPEEWKVLEARLELAEARLKLG
ncbi:MAG: ATP synthase F1 subunit epsilon [Deltaproteobacteria bacterium]|nr:ATP synthase F1 subunit epsilon [Deltaproteobacteria bacterium]